MIPENSNVSFIDTIKMALKKANTKIRFQEEQYKEMRYSFLKELQAYRDQLFKREKYPDNFEPIDVKYFTGLEILDNKTREVLDRKINIITDDYNLKLLRIEKHNLTLEEKIINFEKICKGKNIAVSIHELDADDIVHKLSIIESEALPIWQAFALHYGNGFFNKMIEMEFGINPDTHEEIGNRFGQEVKNIRIEMNNKLDKFCNEAKQHMQMLKTKLRQAQTDILIIRENQEDEIAKVKRQVYEE